MTYRVSANIFPLVAVTFRRPNLAIPMVALPNVTFLSADSFREDRFPISHPPFEGWNFGAVWRTEKMNVIRHYDVTADEPGQGLIPGGYNRLMNGKRCENRQPLRRAGGHKNDSWPVMPLRGRRMDGRLATRLRLARK